MAVAVYTPEELRERKTAVLENLRERFNLLSPALLERGYPNGEWGYEVRGFSLPSVTPFDEVYYVDDAQVRIGVHPPLPHECDYLERPGLMRSFAP